MPVNHAGCWNAVADDLANSMGILRPAKPLDREAIFQRFVRPPMSRSSLLLKRTFDLAFSAVALLVLSPLLAIVALAIVIESRGPVIYKQARRGFNGDTFMTGSTGCSPLIAMAPAAHPIRWWSTTPPRSLVRGRHTYRTPS